MKTLEENIVEAVFDISEANLSNYELQKEAARERLTNFLNGWREKIKDEVREDLAKKERESSNSIFGCSNF